MAWLISRISQLLRITLKISGWSKSRCPLGNVIIHLVNILHLRKKGGSGQSVHRNTTLMHPYDFWYLLSLSVVLNPSPTQHHEVYYANSGTNLPVDGMCLSHSVWQYEKNESWPAMRDIEQQPIKNFAILRMRWIKDLVQQSINCHERLKGRKERRQGYHQTQEPEPRSSPQLVPPLATIKSLIGLQRIQCGPIWSVRLMVSTTTSSSKALGY